jgi:N-acetylglucosamine kinase-like BadF-type ATPase
MDGLRAAVEAVCVHAGIPAGQLPIASVGVFCLAGADLPVDYGRIKRALRSFDWTERVLVHNDTFAVLRAGTDRGWGVAMVCGAGMNCVGFSADGRVVRFPALGLLSGDLAAGGEWMGMTALAAAIRARDGRGPRTELERAVPQHFGMNRPEVLMRAVYRGDIGEDRLMELPPAVFRAAAAGDEVARGIVNALADEVVAMIVATIRRLRLARTDVDVVLGGGIFSAEDGDFLGRISSSIHDVAPRANIIRLEAPPLAGAVLAGLDELGASGGGIPERVRVSLAAALADGDRMHRAHSAPVRSGGGV